MTSEEIKALQEALNGGTETLTSYIQGLQPSEPVSITLDGVTKFVNENEDAKKWLQSFGDKRVTEGIETFKKNNLGKIIEDEIAKRYPPESEEAKKLRSLQQEIEQMKVEKAREALTNKALKHATEKGLPVNLIDYFIGQDEDTTMANLQTFEEVYSTAINSAVESRFKDGGRTPGAGAPPPKDESKMTDAEWFASRQNNN